METFKEKVIWLNPEGKNDFPERFDSEIYYSKEITTGRPTKEYTSNFSIKHVFEGRECYLLNGKYKEISQGQTLVVNNQSQVKSISAFGSAFSIFICPKVMEDCFSTLIKSDEERLEYPFDDASFSLNFFDDVMEHKSGTLHNLQHRLEVNPDLLLTQAFYYELAEDLIFWQNDIHKRIGEIKSSKFETRKEIFRRVNMARSFINDNLSKPFNLTLLAKEVGMSKYHLIRSFKFAHGTTPHKFYLNQKLEKARKQILNSQNKSITEIAIAMGYPDLFSFSKQFKQMFGYSPSQLRADKS